MSGAGAGTSGRISGTTLRADFWVGWAIFGVAVTLVTVLEVGNELNILRGLKVATPAWRGWTNGWSSVISLMILYPAVRILADRTSPACTPPWKIVALQAPAALAFWALHYLGYSLIRLAVYRAFGAPYVIGSDPILYEAPRDLSAYAVIVGIMWLSLTLRRRAQGLPETQDATPATFDIRDNARVIRVATSDILAVGSAGNYVEFHLGDGRRPLMRATLSAIEARLKPQGFARTHRSWLANISSVIEIKPTGAGDFTLVLRNGLEIPLSRRFRGHFNGRSA